MIQSAACSRRKRPLELQFRSVSRPMWSSGDMRDDSADILFDPMQEASGEFRGFHNNNNNGYFLTPILQGSKRFTRSGRRRVDGVTKAITQTFLTDSA